MQGLRHVVERDVEAAVLFGELVGGALALGDVLVRATQPPFSIGW